MYVQYKQRARARARFSFAPSEIHARPFELNNDADYYKIYVLFAALFTFYIVFVNSVAESACV